MIRCNKEKANDNVLLTLHRWPGYFSPSAQDRKKLTPYMTYPFCPEQAVLLILQGRLHCRTQDALSGAGHDGIMQYISLKKGGSGCGEK